MDKFYGILLTLLAGLFFLVGGLIFLKAKNKDKLNNFSVALSFVIMLSLVVVDLLPEILELLEDTGTLKKILIMGIAGTLGFILLKLLDLFIPSHHHEHHDNETNHEEHESHIKHIGILTVFGLVLHNLLEGFAIFGMTNNSFKIGLFTSLSVALHNIPLGMQIFSSLNVKKNKLLILILTLSSLFGGLVFLAVGEISGIVLAGVTAVTLGMILYILFMELWPLVRINIKKQETILGILLGLGIFFISILL